MFELFVDGKKIGEAKSLQADIQREDLLEIPRQFGKTFSYEFTMQNARMGFTMTPVMKQNFKSVMLPIQTMNYASKKRGELPWRKN